MIVPSFTDEQILQELMDDWPSVKRHAKKVGAMLLKQMPKGRIGMDSGILSGLSAMFRSKNGNTWLVCAYCLHGSTQWWSSTACMVENDYGTRSYFFLRGMNTPHQYYVELIPHAIRRMRERYTNPQEEAIMAEMTVDQICAIGVFDRHECGIFFKAGKIRRGKFEAFTDGDGNTPGVVLMKNTMFYARMTPRGNFIFKTFIVPEAEEGTPKDKFTLMLFGIYQSFNMPKGRQSLDDRAQMLLSLQMLYPTMRHHLEHFTEKVVPLYP